MKMENLIFYEGDDKHYGAVKPKNRARHCYNHDVKVKRFSVLDCTSEYVEDLFEIFRTDKETFNGLVKDELNNNFNNYSN